jgi:hypothetical protein
MSKYCCYHQGALTEAIRTSETSVYFNYTTRRYIPEGCHLHTRRRKNMKSQNYRNAEGVIFILFNIEKFY